MKRLFAAAICSFGLVAAVDANAELFTEEVVHYPGSMYTVVGGINDNGEVVGDYDNRTGAFIFDGAGYRGFNGVAGASLIAINNLGQIIGTDTGGAFLYDGGSAVPISYPGAQYSRALDINNNGQVLGTYSMDDGTAYNYIYDNGSFKTLDLSFNGAGVLASGFNDLGDLAGSYSTGPGWADSQGFIYSNGVFTSVDHPFSGEVDSTFLTDINNSGTALGGYINDLLEPTNFVYDGGVFTELPGMYTDRSYAYSINNLGQVSGSFYGPYQGQYDDIDHGFIISPVLRTVLSSPSSSSSASVPEPSSMLLIAGAIAGVLGYHRRLTA